MPTARFAFLSYSGRGDAPGMQDETGRFIKSAANAAPGLSIGELSPGQLVTLSPNRVNGDRTLTRVIWEIVAINDGHALLRCFALCHLLEELLNTSLVALHEYAFYAADEMTLQLDSDADSDSATD